MSAIATRVSREAIGVRPAVTRIFGVMFWKEVRELAPWAALAAIGFSIALGFVLYVAAHDLRGYESGWQGFSILATNFNLVTVFVIPIMALLLGFLQFIAESKSDRFAFLVHRPSIRSLLFLAKILPGLAVYLAATVLPLAVAILWAKDPHHLAYPFRWDMVLPALADVCAGVAYYFAGVLVARRTDARWWGSRLLPIAAALVASGMNYAVSRFYWAVLADLVATGVLLAAARGAFVGGGQYFPQPRYAKAALGLVLAVAVFMIGIIALGMLASLTVPRNPQYRYSNIVFQADGNLARDVRDADGTEHLEDLAGKLIADISDQDWNRRGRLQLNLTPLGGVHEWYLDRQPFRFSERYFVYAFTIGRSIAWFRSAESDYLVGYDTRNRALLGAIGPDGFAAMQAVPPTRFKSPVLVATTRSLRQLVASGDTLYRLGDGYQLEPIFTTPDHAAIMQMGQLPEGEEKVSRTAIATEGQVLVLSDGTAPRVLARYAYGPNRQSNISAAYLEKSQEYLFEFAPLPPNRARTPKVAAYVKPTDGAARVVTLPEDEFNYGRPNSWERWVPALCPPGGFVAIGLIRWVFDDEGFQKELPEFLSNLTNASILGLVTAVVMLGLGRAFQWPRGVRICWTVLGMLLGPMGLLVLLCLRPMGPRVVCATCGRRRPAREPQCARCGAEFAPPKPTGTEIFA